MRTNQARRVPPRFVGIQSGAVREGEQSARRQAQPVRRFCLAFSTIYALRTTDDRGAEDRTGDAKRDRTHSAKPGSHLVSEAESHLLGEAEDRTCAKRWSHLLGEAEDRTHDAKP
jgi:hypothetical protein